MNTNHTAQLELTLPNRNREHGANRRQHGNRAQWWFNRMREVVDAALEWQPAPAGRPEQLHFAGAHRLPLSESQWGR